MKKLTMLLLFACTVPFITIGCGGGSTAIQEETEEDKAKEMNEQDMEQGYGEAGYGK